MDRWIDEGTDKGFNTQTEWMNEKTYKQTKGRTKEGMNEQNLEQIKIQDNNFNLCTGFHLNFDREMLAQAQVL